MHRSALLALALAALTLAVAGSATASNTTLRTTLQTWSEQIGLDAHSVALAAQRRHPRRMTSSAVRFRIDAVRARTAISHLRPSTAKGAQARRLVLAAFRDYTLAGSKWAASGRARLAHHRAASIAYAKAGAAYAHTANTLLVSAGRLLR